MSFKFNSEKVIKLYIAQEQPECVILAVKDLVEDIKKVCCNALITGIKNEADIVVCMKGTPEFDSIAPEVRFAHEEEYLYKVEANRIYFLGADDLGTMWAIYTFIEAELNIPPFYYFDNIQIKRQTEIVVDIKNIQEHPHTKFRGWFVNDEDLLAGYKSKGKRDIDYIFYHDIVHPDLMEKIVETALRYKINLIIPATLVDICNPDEENLVKIVSRRGLYVSQHHIEPMGVSHFGFARFVKQFGYSPERSFIDNKDTMIKCWEYYAEKWAKYPKVVWQLGLRGAGDKPVWATDKKVGNNPEYRGKLISEAIEEQYRIISSVSKGEIYSTSTVWMEGAKLIQEGYLKLPKNTVSVFADIGMSQMFGDDFFTVPRESSRKYGIYYHSQYWHTGPHLSEGVLPEKIDYNYGLSRRYKSDYYAVLNVGNIKEFTFSININAKLAWYGEKITLAKIIEDYCRFYSVEHAKMLKEYIHKYYDSMGDVGENYYKYFCDKYDFNYHKYDGLPFPTVSINDGIICFVGRCLTFEQKNELYNEEFGKMINRSYLSICDAYKQFEAFEYLLGDNLKTAYQQKWLYQAYYWKNLFAFAVENCKAIEEVRDGNTKNFYQHYDNAASFIKNILDARKRYYVGEWADWFNDERKLDLPKLYEFCNQEKNKFQN